MGDFLSDFRGKMFKYVFFILSVFFLSVLAIIFLIQREAAIKTFYDNVDWISNKTKWEIVGLNPQDEEERLTEQKEANMDMFQLAESNIDNEEEEIVDTEDE